MLTYSSKDFGKTKDTPQVDLPETLIHRQVESGATDLPFSHERHHPVFVVDLPSRTISLTVGHLAAGESTREHRHTYETILYILEGRGRTWIESQPIEWKAGDAVYVPVWAWHFHQSIEGTPCRYLACENAPLLQNLGNVALREER